MVCEAFEQAHKNIQHPPSEPPININITMTAQSSRIPHHLKVASVVLCLSLPLTGLAQDRGFGAGGTADSQGSTTPPGGLMQLAPFQYIPPPGAAKIKQLEAEALKRSPEERRIMELNLAGDYQNTGTLGLALLEKEKPDDELQLIIANSLAWTGRLKEATAIYQGLSKGKFANEANVGLANIYRWRGRDDQAEPLYRSALASDPTNVDAQEGLALAGRELSPRTMVSMGGSSDSSDMQRRLGTVNHRWRNSANTTIMEVETSAIQDTLAPNQAKQQDVSLRYQDLAMALKPSLELSLPTNENTTLFGTVRLTLDEDQSTVQVGRVNWGRIATNPNALAAGMNASYAGAIGRRDLGWGKVVGRLNYYNISDGNTIFTSSLNVDLAWRPLGSHYKPFFGIETREAKFNTRNYWSPEQGSGTAYAGLMGEWSGPEWTFYASGQLSQPLFGDAGAGWSVLAGGRRWVSSDVALSMNLWSMASWRDNSAYRAQSASVNLEKLWR